jgi:UDP-glucose 4-epimerase
MIEDFYNNKSILVTGGDGFIGSHLVERLVRAGGEVSVLSHSDSLRNLGHIEDKLKKVIRCDIKRKDEVERIKVDLDIAFHLAAKISISESIREPESVRAVNVGGTKNILDLAVREEAERFVYVSTSSVYDWSDRPISEKGKINPPTPYGKTKLEAEHLCIECQEKFVRGVAIPRFFNAYGPRQRSDVVALFVKKALNDRDIIIEGDGKQKRDFINVKDIVNALLLMGSVKSAANKVVNFGLGKGTEIVALAEKIIELSGSSSKIVHAEARTNEGSSVCDYSRARNLFSWEPTVSLNQGLSEMIEWAKTDSYFGS